MNTSTNPINAIAQYHSDLTAFRRDLHAHPELGFEEHYTSARVKEALKSIGVDEIHDGIEAQTRQAFKNLQAVIETAGGTLADVVKATIFISNMDDFAAINEVYAQYFTENQPARECVAVKTLPRNANVEISVIAWKA